VFSIRLPDGRFGYAQFLQASHKNGRLYRILDLVTDTPVAVAELANVADRFGPLYCNVWADIERGSWQKIGRLSRPSYEGLLFLDGHYDPRNGRIHYWFIVDGERDIALGQLVPARYRHLERAAMFPGSAIAYRLMHGKLPEDLDWMSIHEDQVDNKG
jgi:hypothetical protein